MIQPSGEIVFNPKHSKTYSDEFNRETIKKLLKRSFEDALEIKNKHPEEKAFKSEKHNESQPSSNEEKPEEETEKRKKEGEAKGEFLKETVKKEQQSEKRLDDLVEASHTVLLRVKSASFLNLFPTEIIIAPDKITVIEREFFGAEEIHTFPIKDIKEATVSTSPLFAKLELVLEGFHEGPLSIKYLPKEKALRARRLLQGLKICHDEEIELSHFEKEELCRKVEELGKAQEAT